MLRFFVVLAVAGTIMAGAFASAATLGSVTTSTLGAGDAYVTSCDSDGVKVDFVTQTQDNTGGTLNKFEVIGATVSEIAPACDGKYVLVSIGENNTQIGFGITSAIDGGSATVQRNNPTVGTWLTSTPVWATDVTDVHLIIKDTPN